MRRLSRRSVLAAAIALALVGVMAGVVVLQRPNDGRAPSEQLVAAVATDPAAVWWSSEVEDAGAPGSPERLRLLLTEVGWSDDQAADLSRGLIASAAGPEDAAPERFEAARNRMWSLVSALGEPDLVVDPRLQPAALEFLAPWTGTLAALIGRISPREVNASADPTGRLALWRAGGTERPVTAFPLVSALGNLGDTRDHLDPAPPVVDFVRDHTDWLAPLVALEPVDAPRDGWGRTVERRWFMPAGTIVAALVREQCLRADGSVMRCENRAVDELLSSVALRATYENVPVGELPEGTVMGGERVGWDELDGELAAYRRLLPARPFVQRTHAWPAPPAPTGVKNNRD